MQMLEPLRKHYTGGLAGLKIGNTGAAYMERTVRMEAFARPLWGLVPYWAGGGKAEEFAYIYRKGLVNGTNPDHPEYWGEVRFCDQKFVEMAALSYGLLFAGDRLWDPLSDDEKKQVGAWLNKINEEEVADNNWQFFRILTNVALKHAGAEYSAEALSRCLDRIEDFYLGDGWYQDGLTAQKDYYIAFAIHFYSLVYVAVMEEEDPERCRRFRERASLFAKQFIYWFSESGEALPYGRSLTYRFAQAAFWSMAAVTGVEGISLPVIKGIILRHLDYWMKKPMFDNGGILTIGYGYPCLHMAESYNAPGSPYWSMKAFAFLMLPDDHPFWTVEAAALPKLKALKTLEYGEMVVQRRHGDVTAYVPGVYHPNGQVHVPEKYSKFAYSTYFGFSVPRSSKKITEAAPDSMLAFEISGHIFVREMIQEFSIKDGEIRSRWSPFEGINVETLVIPTEEGHRRIHRIASSIACVAYDCGFAVSTNQDGFRKRSEGQTACAENARCFCQVTSNKGGGTGVVLWGEPNTNLLCRNTEIPAVKYEIKKGTTEAVTDIETDIWR